MSVRDESSSVAAATMAGRTRMMKWLPWLPWLLLALGLWVQTIDPGRVMSSLRFLYFDYYQRTAPRVYVDPAQTVGTGVRYIDIDNESIKRIGQWPWSRKKMADLVDKVRAAGAKVLVFDVVFAEADRTTPALLVPDLPDTDLEWAVVKEKLAGLKNHDAIFADALRQMPSVTGFILNAAPLERLPALKVNPGNVGASKAIGYLPTFSGVTATLPEIEEAVSGNGSLNTITEADGMVRRVPILLALGDRMVPSISAEAIRIISGRRSIVAKTPGASDEANFGGGSGITKIQVGKTAVPTTADGQMWIHFTKSEPTRRIPAFQVFDGTADPALLKDSVIFLGTTAEGLRDIRATPVDSAMAGVEVQVMAVEQMLLGKYLTRPDYAGGMELAFAAVVALFVLLLIQRISPYWIAAVAFGGIALAFGFSWYYYAEHRLLIDPIGPSVVIALVFLTSGVVRFMQTEAERRTVRSAFAQYLPPKVVEEIARDPSKLKLGGTTRQLTIMFCDIRGFTSIAESFRDDPQSLTKLINRVLTPLSQSVLDNNGTIDKYIGDCIMAFWNAPLDDPDHAANAAKCVLEMEEKLRTLNAQLDSEGFYKQHKVKRIAIGVGLNSGPCVVGNMGSDQRFDYSALGDAVNLSARFQTLSNAYGTYIVVGEDTMALIAERFTFMQIDYVIVKGRATPTKLYALLGGPEAKDQEPYKTLNPILQGMFAAIKARDWDAARAAIASGRAVKDADKTIFDTFEQRLKIWTQAPANGDWTGAWIAIDK
jgi:adenylate cyclase